MKKIFAALLTLLSLSVPAAAGDITAGAAPGTINYQGRLERDNAPLTGIVHLTFRVYDVLTGDNSTTTTDLANCTCAPTCPDPFPTSPNRCIWSSRELPAITASQGIFNATMTLPWQVLGGGGARYLEVQVEEDALTPREPLSSVAYALVAKKLEDGTDLRVSTLSLVNGNIIISTIAGGPSRGIRFPNGTWQYSAGTGGAVDNLTGNIDAIINAGTGGGGGKIIFSNYDGERARIVENGNFGIGTSVPATELEVAGNITLSGAIYTSTSPITIGGDLAVTGGKVGGSNSEYLSIGETDNAISLVSGGAERLRVSTNGFVGVGLGNPSASLQAAGVIYSTTALRGGAVTIGVFDANSLAAGNEIRTVGGAPLVLQNYIFGSDYNVGIGTSAPAEKLHVLGSVRAEKGLISSTAAFAGAVTIGGDFTANSSFGSFVHLSTTTVYGGLTVSRDLTVLGNIVRPGGGGNPAYIDSTNNFNFANTFSGDVFATKRVGVGVVDFDFPEASYLQVGDPVNASTNSVIYIAGGTLGNAMLKFYRGGGANDEAARFETQSAANLALVVGGQTKTLTDGTYHRIQNSAVWISTGYNTTPAIFVSSELGNVGMGTSVMDPNWRLTVQGNVRLSTTAVGQNYGLIFPDGSKMTSAGLGSADSISNNIDAVIEADANADGSGNVILKSGGITSLAVKSGGNIAIGGQFTPSSLVNIRGGDLVLGTLAQSGGSASEDIFVAGNVRGYGDINAANNLQTGGTTRISNSGTVGSGGANAAWDGATIAVNRGGTGLTAGTPGGLPYYSGAAAMTSMPAGSAGQALLSGAAAAPGWGTLSPSYGGTGQSGGYSVGDILYASAAGTLTKLADIATGNALISGGVTTAPSYGKIGLTTHISGTLPVANGGTNSASALSGSSIIVSNGTSIVQGAAGSATTLLHGNAAGTPTYSAVSLTADVSGILPSANGGTANGFTAFSGPATSAKTFTLPDASALILTDNTDVTVAQGGTGLSAGTPGGLPYYSGAAAMTSMAAGSAGQALLSGGAGAPSWSTLSASFGGTGQSGGYAVGDILYASAAGTLTKLAAVATGNALISGGVTTAPSYGKIGLTTHVSGTLPVANGGTGATTLTGVVKGNGAGALTAMTGAANTLARWTDANTIGQSILVDNGSYLTTSGGFTTASSGTFRASGAGQYSIETSSGIILNAGALVTPALRMTTGANNNYVLISDASGNASWGNPAAGGLGDGWVGNEITNTANGTLTRSGLGIVGNEYMLALNLGNANTWTVAQTFSGGLTCTTCVSLTTEVSGTLPVANGGTGNTTGNAATVTTNANLTGVVTSIGNATAIANGAISNAMLANGAVANLSGTNTGDQTNISGNAATVTTNANLTGVVTSVGNATSIANGAITNAMLVNGAVANLSGTNTGDQTNISGNAATVTTNANLTGVVTSVGNATSIANGAITNAMLANGAVANLSGTNTGDQTNISGNAGNVTGTVAVGNGGTGQTSLTSGSVLVGNGAGAVSLVAPAGNVTFQVVGSTITSTCYSLTFTNGILTAKTTTACN